MGLRLTPDGGVGEQSFVLRIAGGKATLREEPIPAEAKLVLSLPAGTWAAILLGKKSLESALFRRQLEVEGKPGRG